MVGVYLRRDKTIDSREIMLLHKAITGVLIGDVFKGIKASG